MDHNQQPTHDMTDTTNENETRSGSAEARGCTKAQTHGLPFKLRRVDHCKRCGVPFQEPGTFAWDTETDEYILIPCPQCGSEPNETYEERSKKKWRRATAYR